MSHEHPSGLPPEVVWHRYTRYPYVLARVAAVGAAVYATWWILTAVNAVLFPVFLSLLLAYLLDPAVDWFEARGFDRTTGIGILLGLGALGIAAMFVFLLPTIQHLTITITKGVPTLIDLIESDAIPWIEANTGATIPVSLSALIDQYRGSITDQLPKLIQNAGQGLGDILSRTGDVIAWALNLVMIPVFTFFFLRDFDRMRLGLVDYLPAHNRSWILERIIAMDDVVGAWFRGQIEVALILAALYAIGLAITFGLTGIGVTTGIAIGLLAGLLNVVPYLGFAIGFGLSMLLSLIDWEPMAILGVVLTFVIVQSLEGYVITPRIVGEKVGLSPVVVIIALLVGGELLGLLGVLLALPIAGIIRVLLPDAIEQYKQSTFFTGEVLAAPPGQEVPARDPVDPPAPTPVPPPEPPTP